MSQLQDIAKMGRASGDLEGAVSAVEVEVRQILNESLGLLEADGDVKIAGLTAYADDEDRFAAFMFHFLRSNWILELVAVTDPDVFKMLRGLAQTLFLFGYIAGKNYAYRSTSDEGK